MVYFSQKFNKCNSTENDNNKTIHFLPKIIEKSLTDRKNSNPQEFPFLLSPSRPHGVTSRRVRCMRGFAKSIIPPPSAANIVHCSLFSLHRPRAFPLLFDISSFFAIRIIPRNCSPALLPRSPRSQSFVRRWIVKFSSCRNSYKLKSEKKRIFTLFFLHSASVAVLVKVFRTAKIGK